MHNCATNQTKTEMKPKADMNLAPDEIREVVSQAYGEKVTRPAGAEGSGGRRAPKGLVAEAAGYRPGQLAALPDDAVANSFGCGDPVSFAGMKAGDVVLDLGSGAGIDLLLAAKKVGAAGRVIGVDMTDEMIAKARENIRTAGYANVEVRKGVIEQLPVESASIDWVISNCVINLSPEKTRVFREIARVLKPGGQMLVSDLMAHGLPAELRAVPAFYASCVGGAIPEEEYLAGLRAVGLADVEVRGRLVYDADQLYGYAVSSLEEDPTALAGVGWDGAGTNREPRLRAFIASITGNICSSKVYARKPH